jgi:hypothetical protein
MLIRRCHILKICKSILEEKIINKIWEITSLLVKFFGKKHPPEDNIQCAQQRIAAYFALNS